jgi:DNA-directed RNA polymerase alpha subunit
MNPMTFKRIEIAMAKVEIALGYDIRKKAFFKTANISRAIQVLDALQEELDCADDETPLELLALSPEICGYLYDGGVISVEQLSVMTDDQLMRIDRIRNSRLSEIDDALSSAGLSRPKSKC